MLVIVGRPSGSVTRALLGALARAPGPKRFVSDSADNGGADLEGFEFVRVTPDAPAERAAALAGAKQIVLLPRFARSLVALQVALVRDAQAAGVERIAQISLIGADRRSPVELLRLIGTVEEAVHSQPVPHVIYRCTPFVQAVVHFLRRDPGLLRLVGPFREARFAWIDAGDVGEIVARGLAAPLPENLTTQLCGDEILDFDALAVEVAAGAGCCCEYHDCSPPSAHGMLEAQGVSPAHARALVEYWDYIVSGVVSTTPCDNASRLLGRPLSKIADVFAETSAG